MSNVYAGAVAVVLSDTAVQKVVGKRIWSKFQTKDICDRFLEKTGLRLFYTYHELENCGDSQFDEVSGWFWELEFSEAYVQSQALEALNKKLGNKNSSSIRHYVIFG